MFAYARARFPPAREGLLTEYVHAEMCGGQEAGVGVGEQAPQPYPKPFLSFGLPVGLHSSTFPHPSGRVEDEYGKDQNVLFPQDMFRYPTQDSTWDGREIILDSANHEIQ